MKHIVNQYNKLCDFQASDENIHHIVMDPIFDWLYREHLQSRMEVEHAKIAVEMEFL